MANGFFNVPALQNEVVLDYAPNSSERLKLEAAIREAKSTETDIPMYIGNEEIRTGKKVAVRPPHDHQHILGYYHEGDASHVKSAIEAALAAKQGWEDMSWESRAAIFLKAADLISGPYRYKLNAATMLGQSKNAYQAEIDSACELIDFLRYNVSYLSQIYAQQPVSSKGVWNRMEYRPLEGFVYALTPFNFTAISGNLPASAALMGNVIVWKPSENQMYAANVIMEIFKAAGLPDGVINMISVDGPLAGDIIFSHPEFTGLHFTGSTAVFQAIWKNIGNNIHKYKSYPRIVGETGGKDFVLADETANVDVVATALLRGAFEYQGQKCSAASRAYIPKSLWPAVKEKLLSDLKKVKIGTVEDFGNFVNAVISEKSFDKIVSYIENAKNDPKAAIVAGGTYNKSTGYFVDPTVIEVSDPYYVSMCEEIFGPVLSVYVYEDFDEIMEIIDNTSIYALTGSVISQDRATIEKAVKRLRNAAGNFYINDKPTGAVVGQQPFGGARGSGTNDKSGSYLNLLRWVSPRTIKETFDPPKNYTYPFLQS
ncbi:L-glutamate gamma-semialdehyde dehydrogenase [Dyadobacter psychrotolerans]|uniref:L-glutamate gamma-semialdehyde dehydrogenase n=1 Tax=Dyadobacter psychrotolerans TaxID=2541721 RepID=A0A4R5DQI4_9BACT|nr:L-glutamate gamma-semialdehyde dehydrogenase [Dyadobacter psychrotolerans]TDE14504.1 L-glutamate gamma-semialdehyde dehydrogenase [Dyadobacter psychrotolerans]